MIFALFMLALLGQAACGSIEYIGRLGHGTPNHRRLNRGSYKIAPRRIRRRCSRYRCRIVKSPAPIEQLRWYQNVNHWLTYVFYSAMPPRYIGLKKNCEGKEPTWTSIPQDIVEVKIWMGNYLDRFSVKDKAGRWFHVGTAKDVNKKPSRTLVFKKPKALVYFHARDVDNNLGQATLGFK